MVDINRLIDHLKYGFPYWGDVQRDTIDALERIQELEDKVATLEARMSDIRGMILDESDIDDVLGPVLDNLMSARDAKLKSDKQEFILEGLERYHSAVSYIANNNEFIFDAIDPK